MKNIRFILLLLVAFCFTSCEVEFSPNAEWKDVPVVYCVLDQDDDTTWVRVERCYLGEGNIYSYGAVRDSITYPAGSLSVAILAYQGGVLKDSIPFTETTIDREAGDFASVGMPIFYCKTQNRLKQYYTYVLNIRKTDGSLLATTTPISLVKWTPTTNKPTPITQPSYTTSPSGAWVGGFKFNASSAMGSPMTSCLIEWDTLENARYYQPVVRFYYKVDGDTTYVDLKCPTKAGDNTSNKLNIYYSRDAFLDELKQQLKDDPRYKVNLNMVDVYLHCCTEDLNAYLTSVLQAGGINAEHSVYTNIKGGVGIFAARRTHIYKSMPFEQNNSDEGISTKITQLGINMH